MGANQRDALDRGTHSVAHTLKPSSFYYVYTHSNISDTYRLAVSTSGEPTKECPDIPDKLILRLAVCQDVSVVSVLLIVGVHVVVEESPIISSAQWTLGRSPKPRA